MSNHAPAVANAFLMEEQIVTANGEGLPVAVTGASGRVATLTLGILESVEQQSIEVSIYGSSDGEIWGEPPLLGFPQQFYAGAMAMALDLGKHPDAAFLKARWSVNRWGRGSLTPRFHAYLFLQW